MSKREKFRNLCNSCGNRETVRGKDICISGMPGLNTYMSACSKWESKAKLLTAPTTTQTKPVVRQNEDYWAYFHP